VRYPVQQQHRQPQQEDHSQQVLACRDIDQTVLGQQSFRGSVVQIRYSSKAFNPKGAVARVLKTEALKVSLALAHDPSIEIQRIHCVILD